MQSATDRTGLAIVLSLLALLLFDCMGLIIKHLSDRYTAAELSAYRNFVGLVPSAVALWSSRVWHANGRVLRMRQWKLACLRGIITTLAQFCFYLALSRLPFATAATIGYADALFMTALAVPILGERVGAARWLAVGVGFAGVVMVMKPGGESFTADAFLPLAAAFCYALSGVLARKMDGDVPSPLINLYSSGTSVIGATVLALSLGGFSDLQGAGDVGWILAMGCFGGCAVLLIVISFRMTEQANLAPFHYFGILIAFVLGWMFFGEAPVDDLMPGAIFIAAGGLMIVWRERQMRRARVTAPRGPHTRV
ncbi:DMT family transporter [Roseovarius sp. SCSIO 43702]|uniref:DMT family transporter n=1 Tax=Roseovarius sp. SCSIO 43702 TaxID=2823043 RepID=UPI001C73506C|nr:DMT family transporter [Roseovarius sp. SCSIO 43702]QYX57261.1 DMT family transporter [Roseovarius sp. SCSIO 43702]